MYLDGFVFDVVVVDDEVAAEYAEDGQVVGLVNNVVGSHYTRDD